jgi:hypothetical protein
VVDQIELPMGQQLFAVAIELFTGYPPATQITNDSTRNRCNTKMYSTKPPLQKPSAFDGLNWMLLLSHPIEVFLVYEANSASAAQRHR